jgi:acyl carrier protein
VVGSGAAMTKDEVRSKLRQILIDDFRVPEAKIADESTFRGSFGMDSLDAVDFIYLVSKTYGLKADIAEFRELHTFGLVVEFIVKRLDEKATSTPEK